MMHFFRRSKIHLDCFVDEPGVISAAPVTSAIEVIPDWWKALPKEKYLGGSFFPVPTMKTCKGMYDFYSRSVSLPLWSDLAVKINIDGSYEWKFSDMHTEAEVHNSYQYEGFKIGATGHLKLVSPWLFREATGVKWVYSNPVYSMTAFYDYITLPGILDFKYQHGTNAQLFLNLEHNKVINIPVNTPLAFLTPMSDKKIVVHRHLISKDEHNRLADQSSSLSFINKYVVHRKAVQKQCPYKDHTK